MSLKLIIALILWKINVGLIIRKAYKQIKERRKNGIH